MSEGAPVRRVLVVDDCSINRMVAEATLRTEGYRLATADGGAAALEAIRREKPDLVLLDMRMPGMDGDEVLRRLRGEYGPAIPAILLMTALSDADSAALARDLGADGSCAKPFTPKTLRERVRAMLAARGPAAGAPP